MATTINSLPESVNWRFKRGDTVGKLIQINEPGGGSPVDLTGRTFAAQLRRSPNASTAVSFTVDTSDAAVGQLVLRLDAATTAPLFGDYEWDLQQTMGGTVTTLLAGRVTFKPDVTRP